MRQVKIPLWGKSVLPWLEGISARHRRLAQSWWRHKSWHRRMLRFYAQFLKPGDLAFDVGANVGSRTHVFLQLGARVVAVEPLRECARELYLSLYNNSNFHLVNRALGAAEGRTEMIVAQPHLVSTLSRAWIQAAVSSGKPYRADMWGKTRMVAMTTLDALIAEHRLPSFVKIDAEGFEYEIMCGLSRPLPALSLEFHPCFLQPTLQSIDYLCRFGPIRLNYVIEERFEWMLDEWITPDEMILILEKHRASTEFMYGDVYVRYPDLHPPATNCAGEL